MLCFFFSEQTNSSPYHTIGASTVAVADQNKSNHIFDRSNFGNFKDPKDLQTQLKCKFVSPNSMVIMNDE